MLCHVQFLQGLGNIHGSQFYNMAVWSLPWSSSYQAEKINMIQLTGRDE